MYQFEARWGWGGGTYVPSYTPLAIYKCNMLLNVASSPAHRWPIICMYNIIIIIYNNIIYYIQYV